MFALYLIAGLIALVWGAIFLARGSLVAAALLFLLMQSCFGYEFLHFKLGPVPLTLDRLALALLVGAYIVQRRLGRADPKPPVRIDFLLAAFLGLLALSTLWSQGEPQPPIKSEWAFRLVSGYLIPALVYWVARQTPLDRKSALWIQGVLVVLGVYLAITALLEIGGQWWAVFPRHIADPKVGLHFGRARGPMVHSVNFGLYLGTCLLAAWLWLPRLGRVGRLMLAVLLPLMLAGIFFSYTRSVWIGTALGLTGVMALTLHGAWRNWLLGGIAAAGLLLVFTRMDKIVNFERELPGSYAGKSAELRGDMAAVSWKMFLDRPILGVGFDQFPQAKLAYLTDPSSHFNLKIVRENVHHNTFLSVLTETGLVGLGLYLAVLAGWGRQAWRLARDPQSSDWSRAHGLLMLGVLGTYICQALFHELSYLSMDNTLVFFLAGITVALAQPQAAVDFARPVPMCRLSLRESSV